MYFIDSTLKIIMKGMECSIHYVLHNFFDKLCCITFSLFLYLHCFPKLSNKQTNKQKILFLFVYFRGINMLLKERGSITFNSSKLTVINCHNLLFLEPYKFALYCQSRHVTDESKGGRKH